MSQPYPLCSSSPSSTFHDCKPITPRISSCSSANLNVPIFPTTHKPYSLTPQSKTFLHVTHFSLQDPPIPQGKQAPNSPKDAKLMNPDAKSSPLRKSRQWVKPKSPRAKPHPKKSFGVSSLVELAESLDTCEPSEQRVSEILEGLGDKVKERDAMFILDTMVNHDNVLLAVKYFQRKIDPAKQVVFYNKTLKMFRRIRDFERAEKVFVEMLLRGIKPDNFTFATMISSATRCDLPLKVVQLFEKMPAFGIEPDGYLYSNVIWAYARVGNVDKALSLYDRAKTEKCYINTSVFSALINMYTKVRNYEGCLNIYNDLKALGPKPDRTTYNHLLEAMGKGKRPEKLKALYEEMINNGYVPNRHTYSALLEAYCKMRFSEDALSVYKEMKEKDIIVDVYHYGMLIAMCTFVGYVDEAIEIYEEMKSSGTCKPDSFVFSPLINMFSRMGKDSEAEAILNDMISSGVQPDIFDLAAMVHCYGKAKRTDDIVKTFNQLLDSGITPDNRFWDCLLDVMTQLPKQELGKITDYIEKANPKLWSVVRYLMEGCKSDVGFRKEATEFLNSIDDNNVKMTFCNHLIELCVKLDVLDRARDLWDLGLTLEVYKDIQTRYRNKWRLNLKGLSIGAALIAFHLWIIDLSKALESDEVLPPLLEIVTGIRKFNSSNKSMASVFEPYLKELNAPFHKDTDKAGWFFTTNREAEPWLQSRDSTETVTALNSWL